MTIKKIQGLPKDVLLKFSNLHIRFYKSAKFPGYFWCGLAIPKLKDDEGYVLELQFDPIHSDENDLDFSVYETPFQERSIDNITDHILCKFEERTEMGRRMILLNMSIKGTPFYGYVLLGSDLYNQKVL
ncbi:hypothetical protein [Rhodocyclus tenuis]|uniref:Uncharacterized protein n=1 Tax=Rhodocyclus tenuis TaxID=1066 RepID=A0A840G830_RHOTE|nr:hypothetical protein [Rhodocyclus tenuis]MBB4248026.1 hypothetical protein [Rhodocyclus tenuis]